MNRETAKRIETQLRGRFPDGDIEVTRVPGGLLIEVHTEGSTLRADIGDGHSALFAALGVSAETDVIADVLDR